MHQTEFHPQQSNQTASTISEQNVMKDARKTVFKGVPSPKQIQMALSPMKNQKSSINTTNYHYVISTDEDMIVMNTSALSNYESKHQKNENSHLSIKKQTISTNPSRIIQDFVNNPFRGTSFKKDKSEQLQQDQISSIQRLPQIKNLDSTKFFSSKEGSPRGESSVYNGSNSPKPLWGESQRKIEFTLKKDWAKDVHTELQQHQVKYDDKTKIDYSKFSKAPFGQNNLGGTIGGKISVLSGKPTDHNLSKYGGNSSNIDSGSLHKTGYHKGDQSMQGYNTQLADVRRSLNLKNNQTISQEMSIDAQRDTINTLIATSRQNLSQMMKGAEQNEGDKQLNEIGKLLKEKLTSKDKFKFVDPSMLHLYPQVSPRSFNRNHPFDKRALPGIQSKQQINNDRFISQVNQLQDMKYAQMRAFYQKNNKNRLPDGQGDSLHTGLTGRTFFSPQIRTSLSKPLKNLNSPIKAMSSNRVKNQSRMPQQVIPVSKSSLVEKKKKKSRKTQNPNNSQFESLGTLEDEEEEFKMNPMSNQITSEHILELENEDSSPMQRDPLVLENLIRETEKFEQDLGQIVANDRFMKGVKDILDKQERNPNQLNMFKQDFQMKLARIENSFDQHVTKIGDQILAADQKQIEDYEKSKLYNPMGNSKVKKIVKPKQKNTSTDVIVRQQTNQASVSSKLPNQIIEKMLKSPTMNLNLQNQISEQRRKSEIFPKPKFKPQIDIQKQEEFLAQLFERNFITQIDYSEENKSSTNEKLMQISSVKSETGMEKGELTQIRHLFAQNLAMLENSIGKESFNKDKLTSVIGQMLDQELQDDTNMRETQIEMGNKLDPTSSLDYYKKNLYQSFKKVSLDIKDNLQFAQIAKSLYNPEIMERLQDDPRFKFLISCKSQLTNTLPVLNKIRNKTLNLTSYKISEGLAKAVGSSFKKQDNILNRVIFDSNGLKDEDFKNILSGLYLLQDVKSIIYNNNEFNVKSAEVIQQIITTKMIPFHLEELRIINCKISPVATQIVLDALNEKCFLKKLSLVRVGLNNETNMNKLIEFVKTSRYLIDLDISWNSLKPGFLFDFLETISENRQLQFLNLSWNNLLDKADLSQQRGGPEQIILPEEEINEEMAKFIKKGEGNQEIEKYKEKLDDPKEYLIFLLAKVTRFIKYNKNLIHFDLSHTGLNEQAIRTIGTSLRRGRSIVSLHLSGNPGVNQSLKDFLFQRLRCKQKSDNAILDNFNTMEGGTLEYDQNGVPLSKKELFDRIVKQSLEGQEPMKQYVQDGVELSNIAKQKGLAQMSISGRRGKIESQDLANEDQKLILTRWVGHKEEMPGSGQWQMITEQGRHCWVCDKWIYSLIFWSKDIGASTCVYLDEFDKERITEQLELINHDNKLVINQELTDSPSSRTQIPLISADFTDWKFHQMISLDKICMSFDKTDYTFFIKQLKDRWRCRTEVKTVEDMNQEEKERLKRLIKLHHNKRRKNWRQTLVKGIKYNKKPFLVNGHLVPVSRDFLNSFVQKMSGSADQSSQTSSSDEEGFKKQDDIWVYPCFLPAGKHSFFVKNQFDYYPHKFLAPFREEDIPACNGIFFIEFFFIECKDSKSKTVQRVFKKETSVFRDWREDTPTILKKACELDLKEWKANRLIKDPIEVERCNQVIEKNFEKLKDYFITVACKSNFPSITLLDFTEFAQHVKTLDKNVVLATIDRHFIATNVEIIANDENPDKELCRFEFFEIMLRLSNAKYRETQICSSYSEALEKYLKDNVYQYYKPHSWQDFRDSELWTVDVNDVLEANLEGLKKVYAHFFDPRKKYMTMNDALDVMIRLTPLSMTEKDAIYCYGMCKMTVVNEAEDSTVRYKRLQFVELLELMGRIADVKFKGTEMEHTMTLAQKIEFVLDDVLSLVEVKRKDVKITVEEHSESDDDY